MNKQQITDFLLGKISDIAPDADTLSLDPDEDMRDELDLDSMDYLQLIEAVAKELKVTVAPTDLGKITSLNQMVDYIAARLN